MTARSVSEKSKDTSAFEDRTRERTTYTRSQCTSGLIRCGVVQCATRPGSAGVVDTLVVEAGRGGESLGGPRVNAVVLGAGFH